MELEDTGEAEPTEKASSPTSPPVLNETRTQEFPLALLHSEPDCEVYPDLHSIIQVESRGSRSDGSRMKINLTFVGPAVPPCGRHKSYTDQLLQTFTFSEFSSFNGRIFREKSEMKN